MQHFSIGDKKNNDFNQLIVILLLSLLINYILG